MNTLHNHVIIYDKDCPLCNLYTDAFIKTNMLDKSGRQNFCDFNPAVYPSLDLDTQRSRDEIALINTQSGTITYGIDSLFKILGHNFPICRIFFNAWFFRLSMRKLYSFISYNRKVIAPAKTFEAPGSCTPTFNLTYRWTYIVLSWIFTSMVLTRYAVRLQDVIPPTNFFREWLICGGQIVFQAVTVSFIRRDRLVHYLGNMMTVSNIGALLLIPALFIPVTSPVFFISWFVAVVSFMLFEHYRRAKILGLSSWASVSWVVYRFMVLGIIFML
jgi:predicted DCC family thiol-disulfide oxidoreductase YuxK